jgi:hypothetical protein
LESLLPRPGTPDEWEVLDKISAWCDEHGWDELDSLAFNEWLKSEGIDRSKLMIGKCRMPDYA